MSEPQNQDVPVVYIEWLDSLGCSSNWTELTDVAPRVLTCRSIGWLLHNTDESKVIVPHLTDPDHPHTVPQGCGDMTIPTRAIVKMIALDLAALVIKAEEVA